MLVKRNLRFGVNEYIHSVLSFDNILCRCLRNVLQAKTENIDIYAFLPVNLDVEDIVEFDKGGIYSKAARYLPRYLLDRYGGREGIVFLLDDVMSIPTDNYLIEANSTVCTIESEVYHLCESNKISEQALEKIVWACAVSWHFVCVVLEGKDSKLCTDIVSEFELCSSIKENLLEIIIGAFDGEGYIHYTLRNPCSCSRV